jgi:tetratricopeptide (TPR) repeat protein
MTDQFTYKQLPTDPCLTQEQMLNYIDGKLSFEEQHVCEKHMADCDLCADALEGLELVKNRDAIITPAIESLQNSSAQGKVVALQPSRNNKMWYAAAAVLVLILGSVFLFKQITDQEPTAVTAANETKSDSSTQPSLSNEWTVTKDSQLVTSATGGVDGNKSEFTPALKSPNVLSDESLKEQADETPMGANYDMEDVAPSFAPPAVAEKELAVTKDVDAASEGVQDQDKKAAFWDRAKAIDPAPKNNEKANQQSLAKDDNRATSSSSVSTNDAPVSNAGAASSPQEVVAAAEEKSEMFGQVESDSAVVNSNAPHPLKPSDNDLELSYTNGVNLMNSGQYNSAIVFFDEVLKVKTHPRYEDAEFQKANALIKSNRKPEAKILLQSIEAKKGKHAAEATALLKTL